MTQRKEIEFDESDKNLFQVDDARLGADALKFCRVDKARGTVLWSGALLDRAASTDPSDGIDVLRSSLLPTERGAS